MTRHALAISLLGATALAQDVAIPARDGATIEATYYSPGKPGPAAIIFRNCDQQRAAVDGFAKKLRDAGVHVVAYDYRGSLMPGRDFLQTRYEDFGAVHDWLVRQRGIDSLRLASIGGSCGAQLALQFALAYAPRVKASIIMSGPSTTEQKAFVARSPEFAVLAAASVGENSEQNVKPVADASKNANSRLIVLPGRSHGTNMLSEPTGLEAIALTWLMERLGIAAAALPPSPATSTRPPAAARGT